MALIPPCTFYYALAINSSSQVDEFELDQLSDSNYRQLRVMIIAENIRISSLHVFQALFHSGTFV